jgi:hypothetical protein
MKIEMYIIIFIKSREIPILSDLKLNNQEKTIDKYHKVKYMEISGD